MIDLKTVFPKASKSFLGLNSATPEPSGKENALQTPPNAKKRPSMNKTEAEFAMILEAQKRKGEILRYEFEGITLRWFDMRYTPDFVVFCNPIMTPIGAEFQAIKFIEVKGAHIHYSQQAMARFKGARGFWPEFSFELHQKTKEGWKQLL